METMINIYWTRHAESCSNYTIGSISDKIPIGYENNIGNDKIENIATEFQKRGLFQKLTSVPSDMRAAMLYHPNLSFIGMQQAIQLGPKFYNDKKIDIVFASPTVRTILTALLAFRSHKDIKKIYVVPYISEIQNAAKYGQYISKDVTDYQNTPIGKEKLFRIFSFLKNWLQKNWFTRYDDIELIDRLHELKKTLVKDNEKYNQEIISIDAFLNCHQSNYQNKNSCDYDETFDNLKNSICKLLTNNIFDESANAKSFFEKLTSDDIKLYRGPEIDFSLLEEEEKVITIDKIPSNINEFYKKYINTNRFKELMTEQNQSEINICCVSHGSALRSHFKTKDSKNFPSEFNDHIDNTQVFHERYNGVIDYKSYIPNKIRSSYQNFEALNTDICRSQSIKGAINYPLWNYEKEWSSVSFYDALQRPARAKDVMDDDVKEAYADKYQPRLVFGTSNTPDPNTMIYWKNDFASDAIKNKHTLKGGDVYKRKYLKYKKKYLQKKMKMKIND